MSEQANQQFPSGRYEIVLKRVRDIPSLPEVVNKIVELMSFPNTPASKIADLISYDPGLTSKVLRMVNSAAFGFQRQISSVQHGIMILGFNTVRGLVLSASIFKLFEGQEGSAGKRHLEHKEFWQHSMATAILSRAIAVKLRIPDTDDAFSAGMLHDIGKIVLDVYLHQEFEKVLEGVALNRRIVHGEAYLEVEQRTIETDHGMIGSFLANKWRLPVSILEVIAHHHRPQEAENCTELVHVVALANEMARIYFYKNGVIHPDFFDYPYLLEHFDLDEAALKALLDDVREELDGIDAFLGTLAASG